MVGPQSRSGNYGGEKKTLSLAQPLNRPRHPQIFLLGLQKKKNLRHSGTNPEDQVACELQFYTEATHFCGSSYHHTFGSWNSGVPSRNPVQYWHPHITWHPLLTALYRNPMDFPIRNSLGISVTLSGYLWQINLFTSSWHRSSPVRPQLKSGNSRRHGVAVTSVSNYPTNQKATLPRFNAECDQAQLKFSWRWLHAEHFLVVRGTVYIGYSKTIFQSFRKTNTLLPPIHSYLPLQRRKQIPPKLQ
jgi:hypothetical protein